MTDQTRDATIKMIALALLAPADKYTWQAHPNAAQLRKQSRYEVRSRLIVEMVEACMADFKWKHDETKEKDN